MIIAMFSGGVSSFAACLRVKPDLLLFSDTGIEDEDLYRFLDDASRYLQVPLRKVSAGITFDQLIIMNKTLPNNRMPFCSRILKVEVAERTLANDYPECDTLIFGINWDEIHRCERIAQRWPKYKCLFPLCDPPYLSKHDIIKQCQSLGIRPPRLYDLGFAHNNCGGGCVRGGKTAWRHLLKTLPDRYAEWERREQLVPNATFMKDLSLTQLRKLSEDQCSLFDWGGCGCFVDD